jgi:2-methylcitrate dehydratase PrpD
VDIRVDTVTPSVLIYEQPGTGLEAKFSLQFCAAAALVDGRVSIDSFEPERLHAPAIRALMPRVIMRADASLDREGRQLTQARLDVRLGDGRSFTLSADGARGYPERPASDAELDQKFLACAERTLPASRTSEALRQLRSLDQLHNLRSLLPALCV